MPVEVLRRVNKNKKKAIKNKMVYNKASAKDRKKIFEAFQEDRDWNAVAKMCDVKPGTAYKWLINGSATAK